MADEVAWRRWPVLESLAPAGDVDGRVVVLAAHPDDEVLGVGGLLASLPGHRVTFCTATDGEASHPGSPTLSPAELATARRAELVAALRELGHDTPAIAWFGLPDSGLSDHPGRLADLVGAHVATADLVLCPARTDGHTDHDTLGRVAADVCAGRRRVWEYPVWSWAWREPGDPQVPWARARSIALTAQARRRKRAAVRRFVTQTEPLSEDPADAPVLAPQVLEHFDRGFEVVFT